jgi:hypothetical protein
VRLTLTASTTNYVVCSNGGVISTNTTGFTSGSAALYKVTTSATAVTDVEDYRAAARSAVTHSIPISSLRHTTGIPGRCRNGGRVQLLDRLAHPQGASRDHRQRDRSIGLSRLFPLPTNYLAGTPITVRLRVAIIKTGSAVDNGSTIDLVRLQAGGWRGRLRSLRDGGSDVCRGRYVVQ